MVITFHSDVRFGDIIYRDDRNCTTEALDVDNERQINQNLAKLNMTRISVAHRAEFGSGADRILHVCRTVAPAANRPTINAITQRDNEAL